MKWIKKLLLPVFSLVVLLIFLEITSRIFLHAPARFSPVQPSQIYGHEHKPNYSAINEREEFKAAVSYNPEGLRGGPVDKIKPSGVYRIAVVGDSFVDAVETNNQDTFVKKLENKLNAASAKSLKYDVINFGVLSYNADNEFVVIKEKIKEYAPDLVIQVFFFNDVEAFNPNNPSQLVTIDNDTVHTHYPLPKTQNLEQKVSLLRKSLTLLVSHSHLWDYFMNYKLYSSMPKTLLAFQNIKTAIFGETDADKGLKARMESSINQRRFNEFDIETMMLSKIEQMKPVWKSEEMLLKEEKKLMAERGTKFIFVLASGALYYRTEAKEKIKNDYHLSAEDFDPTLPNKNMAEILQRLEIGYIDLLPIISAYENHQKILMHFRSDIHWTKYAHQLVADTLFDCLIRQGLVLNDITNTHLN